MALPAGWLETGISVTVSVTADLKLRAIAGVDPFGVTYYVPVIIDQRFWIVTEGSGANLGCSGLGYGLGSFDTITAYAWDQANEPWGDKVSLTSASGSCTPTWLPAIPVSVTTGPAKVGVTLREVADGTQTLIYRLWPDTGCAYSLDIGGRHYETTGLGARIQYQHANFATGNLGTYPATTYTVCEIANVRWGAESGPTTFDSWYGNFDYYGSAGPAIEVLPPLHYTAAVHVIDANNAEPAHNVLISGEFTQANGASTARTQWPGVNSSTAVTAALTGDWTTAGVTPPSADSALDLVEVPPKTPGTPGSWTPITLDLAASLSVLRSSNAWVGAGWMDVAGSTWTTHEAGCSVTRALKSFWREWNSFGHPKYHADDVYVTTKADYYGSDGQDVWGWSLYAYLDVDMTASVSGSVTLAVTSAVTANAGSAVDTFVRHYAVPVTSGRHTYRVDLLFPTEGGPFYFERVDELAFTGLGVGEYTLHSMTLAAAEDAYAKLSSNGLTLAMDGSMATAFWGSDTWQPVTNDWLLDHQNGLFLVDGGVESYGGATPLTSLTLAQAATRWNRMEGVTATYSGTAMEADLTDGVNTIGTDAGGAPITITRKALWLADVIPHGRIAAGTPMALAASIRVPSVELCPAPAGTFSLTFRKSLGTVLEAQTRTNDRKRGAAGVTVTAKRNPGDVTLGTGVSDASGFVTVGIPNGLVSGAEFTATLEASEA